MRLTAELDGRGVSVVVPQDPGAAGVDMARALIRLLAGFSVTAERETGDKETRADPFAAQVNAGNVRLVRGAWNTDFIEELRTFPAGGKDDQADAAAGAFNRLSGARKVEWDVF
jgi:predicted phage terminase large subunit-like protein